MTKGSEVERELLRLMFFNNFKLCVYIIHFDNKVSKWDDNGNDVIVLAKHMCMIMMEMTDFTRGKGRLKTTMDVITADEYFYDFTIQTKAAATLEIIQLKLSFFDAGDGMAICEFTKDGTIGHEARGHAGHLFLHTERFEDDSSIDPGHVSKHCHSEK